MVKPRRFHLTPPTILAILHISAPLLLLHRDIAPKSLATAPPEAQVLIHTVSTQAAMSDSENVNAAPAPNLNAGSVTAWIQSRLTALYEDVHVEDAFERAFSPACEVRLNHEVRPLQTFRDDLASRRAAATHVSVAWDADVVSTNEDRPEEAAVIAGALVVTRSLPFRIRVGPAQRQTHVRFSAKIERDAGVQDGDQRRITSFYYTSVDRTPPIRFAVPRAAQEGVDGQ